MKSTWWTHTSQGRLPQTGSWSISNFRGSHLQLRARLPTHTPLSHPPQWAPSTPDALLTLPMRHSGKPRETGDWFYERGYSTHYWEGLQSQGKWSWLCCCKFLAISPILSLDLLLVTEFSYRESEYHTLKKKKKKQNFISFKKIRIFYSLPREATD